MSSSEHVLVPRRSPIRALRVIARCRPRGVSFISIVVAALLVTAGAALAAPLYGSDGSAPTPTSQSNGGVWEEPACSSPSYYYDTYTGEVGTTDPSPHTNTYDAPSSSSTDLLQDIEDAYGDYEVGHGVGAGSYFFVTGPQYAPSGVSASQWGIDQANYATTDYNKADEATDGEFSNLVIFGDFEGFSGEPNGWYLNATGTHLADNQDVVSNFINTLENDGTNVGVYSSGGPTSDWLTITNNMTLSVIEWTSAVPCPATIFSDSNGNSAKFFRGQYASSETAFSWQWSEASSGIIGDYDQFSVANYNELFGTDYGA